MGPFLTAYVKTHGGTSNAREQAGRWLGALREYVREEGLGQLPEVFDSEAPQRAGGCIAQAWSVAELLRATLEDVYDLQPAARGRLRAAALVAGAAIRGRT
jgi:glycogen debranching enzyme